MISIFRVTGKKGTDISGTELNERDIPDIMPWSPRLEISIDIIDTHHKELVRLINLLHKAMRLQKGAGEVGGILKELADYTVFHFGFEEEQFEKHGYPQIEAHKKLHKDLVGQVLSFQKDFQDGKTAVSMDLMDFLINWLKTHILKEDAAYVPFLKDKI